ncbi:N-formylglutamate deformylase [Rhodoferax lacus]|uniref:N-formylglutamate deformylase n=1 Tax=Rhodoferax lacus TaxID=2184758 RepID=A0A3E1R8U8_9BURK|nr:N-formylglutamate deformylase [Rhodoferax lacus]RFO95472.1 N-formylglutamate deformylase [Rhodoferax lacus]
MSQVSNVIEHDVFTLYRGSTPLLVSMPHVGTLIPAYLQARYTPRALQLEDTDWHLEAVYDFVRDSGASLIVPRYSRYVIDLNRPSENTPMYAGANNTELCPTCFFTGEPLYREGQAPDEAEIAKRVATYWNPYHATLAAELQRLHQAHGHAVLFDAHSIHSELPWLFEGRLPDLNLGTVNGSSAAPALRDALAQVLASQTAYTQVVDGRFKGGHITRHFGRPAEGLHAVQLEMCWKCYMAEQPPYVLDEARAERVRPLLKKLLHSLMEWTPQ